MATLHVRNVPDALYETLRGRAEKEGRSIGGQTVALLEEALGGESREARVLRRRFRRLPRRDLKPGERLGPGARQVLSAAQQEARALKHNYIGTEHLLLAILRPEGPAARALAGHVVAFDVVRNRVVEEIGEGDEVTPGQIPFTPRAKKVLELVLDLEADFIERAKADSPWQLALLHGLLGGVAAGELLSYEAPTYFGMLCASYELAKG